MIPQFETLNHVLRQRDAEQIVAIIKRIVGETYLDEQQLAERMGLSRKYFQKHRHKGGGIPYLDLGRIRYPLSAVRAYELSRLRRHTSDSGPGAVGLAEWYRQLADEQILLDCAAPVEGA